MSKFNTYVKSKVSEHLSILKAFEAQLRDHSTTLEAAQQKIVDFKVANEDGKYTSVRKELVDLTRAHYNIHLINQSYQMHVTSLHEFAVMAKALEIDLELDEEGTEAINDVMSQSPFAHTVQSGKVILVPGDTGDAIQAGLDQIASNEDALEDTFNGFVIQRG